ncbi:hypothetical protein C8F01DRAFT_1373019 [Mycena amicta]|nr:hypothetical protein C8F01DRAFT_1373019 [Mycena amicta]
MLAGTESESPWNALQPQYAIRPGEVTVIPYTDDFILSILNSLHDSSQRPICSMPQQDLGRTFRPVGPAKSPVVNTPPHSLPPSPLPQPLVKPLHFRRLTSSSLMRHQYNTPPDKIFLILRLNNLGATSRHCSIHYIKPTRDPRGSLAIHAAPTRDSRGPLAIHAAPPLAIHAAHSRFTRPTCDSRRPISLAIHADHSIQLQIYSHSPNAVLGGT